MLNIDKCYELTMELEKSLGGDNSNVILPKELSQLKSMIEEELRMQSAKSIGGSSMAKRLKTIIKYLSKAGKNNEKFGNAWYVDDELCFTNGYTGFILKDKFDVPIIENSTLDLPKYFPTNADTEIKVDLADLKMAIKTHKAREIRKKPKDKTLLMYQLGTAWYNPNLILECYEILGCDIIFRETGKILTPAVLESKNGKAILLPMRPPKDEQKTK